MNSVYRRYSWRVFLQSPGEEKPKPEESLQDFEPWVRQIARALVRDPNQADDLVQQTMLSALESPPKEKHNLRGWFRVATVRFFLKSKRSQKRRTHREKEATIPELDSRPESEIDRKSIQEQMRRMLADLEEPYRSCITLHFLQGLPVKEISRRLEVPLSTVKYRLDRGLALMRANLDRKFGKRDRWMFVLAPLAMKVPKVAAGVKAALILLAPAATIVALAIPRQTTPTEPASSSSLLETPRAEESLPQDPPPAGKQTIKYVGRVVDLDGKPVNDLQLTWVSSEIRRSAQGLGKTPWRQLLWQEWPARFGGEAIPVSLQSNGSFSMEAPEPAGVGWPLGDSRHTVLGIAAFEMDFVSRIMIVVAAPMEISGSVSDSNGNIVVGAKIKVFVPHEKLEELPFWEGKARNYQLPTWSDVSDRDGKFALCHVPRWDQALLHLEAEGFLARTVSVTSTRNGVFAIRLLPANPR